MTEPARLIGALPQEAGECEWLEDRRESTAVGLSSAKWGRSER